MSAAAGLGDPNAAMTSARLETENNNLLLTLIGGVLTIYFANDIADKFLDVSEGRKSFDQLAKEMAEEKLEDLALRIVTRGVLKIPASQITDRAKKELLKFEEKAQEWLISKKGYSKESIENLSILYEVKVGAKSLDDVLKEKGNDFLKSKEFKELASKEGLGIAKNARGQQVLVVKTNSGTKGGWNKELNNPQPNRIYDVDDYKIYQTDELARVFKGKAEITYETLERRGRNGYQQGKARKLGEKDDQGAHLLAEMLGGPGEKINLVPMNKVLNTGEWLEMEQAINNAIKAKKKVTYDYDVKYEGNSNRPSSFQVKYSIDDGRPIEHNWENLLGGK
jgi:hypothetical protein